MSPAPRRYGTGDADLDTTVSALVERVGVDAGPNADLIHELVVSSLRLARDHASRGDLKIASAALKEMRYSFHVFEPYRPVLKASIFGSARTKPEDPLYEQTRRLAAAVSEQGWMVITGAGPGIMAAGVEGAGVDRAFGVSIRLPFESTTPAFVDDDPKLVNFRYFFTRKLTFIKESDGFVLLPGGFGTLDEAFELLTLVQTGKAQPAPIVLLDVPGGTYWLHWCQFVEAELAPRSYIGPHDLALVRVTDDIDVAVDELTGFYANYRSLRFVGGRLVMRMLRAPTGAALAALNEEFADILTRGSIERIEPTKAEVADGDQLDAERLAFRFDRRSWARLRRLIDALNDRPSPVARPTPPA
ncbi:MAG TPA: LOG family protein [Acidimicrobiia bacterium]|nr:LOG family protein [Acidimicrobiia bacterium]